MVKLVALFIVATVVPLGILVPEIVIPTFNVAVLCKPVTNDEELVNAPVIVYGLDCKVIQQEPIPPTPGAVVEDQAA